MDFDYLKQKRILLVDDEQELLDMVSSIFANEGFCNVKTAKTVKEALCIAETFQPELTLDALCEAAWGDNPYGYENSLMTHIRRIREKIEVNPSQPVSLITIKGLGYKLIVGDK